MVISVRAIKATRSIASEDVGDLIARELGPTGVAGDLIREMADYPVQQQTKSGYRRTGDLGRNWKMRKFSRGRDSIFSETDNRLAYAGRVQGRKRGPKGPDTQTREMRRRRWLSIDTGVRRVWGRRRDNIIRIITQRDPRVQARRDRIR